MRKQTSSVFCTCFLTHTLHSLFLSKTLPIPSSGFFGTVSEGSSTSHTSSAASSNNRSSSSKSKQSLPYGSHKSDWSKARGDLCVVRLHSSYNRPIVITPNHSNTHVSLSPFELAPLRMTHPVSMERFVGTRQPPERHRQYHHPCPSILTRMGTSKRSYLWMNSVTSSRAVKSPM